MQFYATKKAQNQFYQPHISLFPLKDADKNFQEVFKILILKKLCLNFFWCSEGLPEPTNYKLKKKKEKMEKKKTLILKL